MNVNIKITNIYEILYNTAKLKIILYPTTDFRAKMVIY